MSLLTKANIKEHCRTCLRELTGTTEGSISGGGQTINEQSPDSKNIHFNISNDPELQQLISINVDSPCTNDVMNPVGEDFPENVCLTCYNKLYSFAIFRRRAQQSAEKLRSVLNCSGNIKVEDFSDDPENEFRKEESKMDKKKVSLVPKECEFQLHDATAENEETFFETSVATLADVEMNDNTVDPFSPSAPSFSASDDNDRDFDIGNEIEKQRPTRKKVVRKETVKKERKQKEKNTATKTTRAAKPIPKPKEEKKDKYRCPQCEQGFAKDLQLSAHVNEVHAAGSTPFICEYCPKSYRNNRSLKEHIMEAHQDKIKEKEHFQCTECPLAFLDKTGLKIHIGLHFSEKKTQLCGLCDARFPVKKWLIEHLRTHTPDGRIPCYKCDKTYNRIEALENHVRAEHLKQKPHHCPVCDKSFQNKQSFRIHSYRHSGKKPYLCDVCGRDFRQPTAMRTHRAKHFKNDESEKI